MPASLARPSATPPERLAAGPLVLRRAAADDAAVIAAAVGASLDHLRPWMAWATPEAADVRTQLLRVAEADELWETGAGFIYVMIARDCAPDGPPGVCAYTGTGTGIAYDGTPGHPNVFQGQQLSNNSLTFTLPLDQPGDLKSHTIRFTNLRAAASMLGQIMPPAFGHIMSIVSASGPMPVPIAFPTQTVGYSQVSLITKPGSGPTLKGCVPQNTGLLDGGKGGTAQFTIRVEEQHATDWLKRSTAPYGGPNVSPSPGPLHHARSPTPGQRDVLLQSRFPDNSRAREHSRIGLGGPGHAHWPGVHRDPTGSAPVHESRQQHELRAHLSSQPW